MRYYEYKYVEGVVLTKWDVDEILNNVRNGVKEFTMVMDLGTSRRSVKVLDKYVIIDDAEIPIEDILSLESGFVYKFLNGKLYRIDFYDSGKYYKLKPVASKKPPTLEINGIQMHRSVDVDPWEDTLLKVSALGSLKGKKVLDVCTGLGYSSIIEVMKGARSVVTVEKDQNVLYIASLNPWSKNLEDKRIEIILQDAVEAVKMFSDEEFDAIFHDPPRFNIAGELYSLEFYRNLYRVLRKGGVIFHYTGEPGKHSNISIIKGIKNRLEQAGFEYVTWVDKAKGFKALKIS
ncbi:RsmD family RNA methyltransferase [Ignisphaera sp. 4213-co]|uniref:RsmD family RNA methyltransferase n=1 Tax=Ignisphaera cupida TaxID=3050454 RepID=A0ABD4Z831_9CREN|nr:RsmD family RNA methyltransferase [Ignisphaera sp. 4213-co]MDK6029040.1 RsmD family RNA methyltransferase [Ignisphaera sp. 4213-co]